MLSKQNKGRNTKKLFTTIDSPISPTMIDTPSSTETPIASSPVYLIGEDKKKQNRSPAPSLALSVGVPSNRSIRELSETVSDCSTGEEEEELDDHKNFLLQRIVQTQRRSVNQFLEDNEKDIVSDNDDDDDDVHKNNDLLVDPPGVMSTTRDRVITSPYDGFEYDDDDDDDDDDENEKEEEEEENQEEKKHTRRRKGSVEDAKRLLLAALSNPPVSPLIDPDEPHELIRPYHREVRTTATSTRTATTKKRVKSSMKKKLSRKRVASGTNLKSKDPIDLILHKLHKRSDPLQWATFSIVKTKRKMKKKGRKTRFDRATFELDIDDSGNGGLDDLTSRISNMRVGIGVAVVKIQHKQKYVMLTHASEKVRGHEIFRINGLRKGLKSRFGAFHADLFARSKADLSPSVIMSGLSKVR